MSGGHEIRARLSNRRARISSVGWSAQAVAAQFGQMPRYVTSTPETVKP